MKAPNRNHFRRVSRTLTMVESLSTADLHQRNSATANLPSMTTPGRSNYQRDFSKNKTWYLPQLFEDTESPQPNQTKLSRSNSNPAPPPSRGPAKAEKTEKSEEEKDKRQEGGRERPESRS